MIGSSRIRILDVPVDVIDMEGALQFIDKHVRETEKAGYLLAVNPEKILTLRKRPDLRTQFEKAVLLIPDGMGLVWTIRWFAGRACQRVAGADLMQNICELSAKRGYRCFFYGATEEVSRNATRKLCEAYPGLQVSGRANGYIKPEEMAELIANINASKTDILFVALGSPRQEHWITSHLSQLEIKLCQGVGGTLDTIDGSVRRAPRFMQSIGLEWFYRLLLQPQRIGRPLYVLPTYISRVIVAAIRGDLARNSGPI